MFKAARGRPGHLAGAAWGKARVNENGYENRRQDCGIAESQGHDPGAAGRGARGIGSGGEQVGDGKLVSGYHAVVPAGEGAWHKCGFPAGVRGGAVGGQPWAVHGAAYGNGKGGGHTGGGGAAKRASPFLSLQHSPEIQRCGGAVLFWDGRATVRRGG